jgi:uncharacterized protein YdeI (YjbR/CyaY-like superfamily)
MSQSSEGTRPTFFEQPAAFRAWLDRHHTSETALWVGFHKAASGRPSLTWPQAVDEALCFGWIDGVRKRVDESRYMIRFTPRKPRSIWSAVNIARATELTTLGRMAPAGLAAFERRTAERSAIYAYEQRRHPELAPAQARAFRRNRAAWDFFRAQAPSYQRIALFWVVSAKRDDTKARRLDVLIADSAAGRRIGPLSPARPKAATRPGRDLPHGENVTTSVSPRDTKRRRSR